MCFFLYLLTHSQSPFLLASKMATSVKQNRTLCCSNRVWSLWSKISGGSVVDAKSHCLIKTSCFVFFMTRAGLASGEKVCLNPRSSWVKKLIQFVLEKQLHQRGGAVPKNQGWNLDENNSSNKKRKKISHLQPWATRFYFNKWQNI